MSTTSSSCEWVIFRDEQGKKMAGKIKGRDRGKLTVMPFAITKNKELVAPTEEEIGQRIALTESECEFFRSKDSLRASLNSGMPTRPFTGDLDYIDGYLR